MRSHRRGNDARRNDCPLKTRSKTTMHKVTSEIYTENDQISEELDNGNAVTEFTFKCPSYMIEAASTAEPLNYDSDDDLDVDRDKEGVILIGTESIIVYSRVYKHIQ